MAFNLEGNSGPRLKANGNIIELKAVTWNKDSHGLFDYESKSLDIKKFYVEGQSNIIRNGEEIQVVADKVSDATEARNIGRKLLSISSRGNIGEERFFIDPTGLQFEEGKFNEVYLIVRSLKNSEGQQKGFPLEVGQVMKLGRMEFRVVELGHPDGRSEKNEVEYDVERIFRTATGQNDAMTEDTKPACRICLLEDVTEGFENLLIAPCKCRGSCEYMHLACFQHWFKSKISHRASLNACTFLWKKLECEVCQEPIPRIFTVEGQQSELFDLRRPTGQPYVILETISRDKKAGKGLHVLNVVEDGVKLGRGHQCDVRIGDISVSRLHAQIKYEGGKFLLLDNNSKFGTLILLGDHFPISEEKVAVQIGRTVITFVVKPKTSSGHKMSKHKALLEDGRQRRIGLSRASSESIASIKAQANDGEGGSPARGMVIEEEQVAGFEANEGEMVEEEVVANAPANCPVQFPSLINNLFQLNPFPAQSGQGAGADPIRYSSQASDDIFSQLMASLRDSQTNRAPQGPPPRGPYN
eukprot:TRINITY_DN588_c0_g1_i10.p1 TRINITY_DN588_c0_g1~~TRINITY_DN588_c0_g1_i10.p1  ORF type:complete len:527 (-),score=115.43 TRINITY_DN588_c0_g1_i10:161-1741(-)